MKEAFLDYVKPFDETNPAIHLKIVHVEHVAHYASEIANALQLNTRQQKLATTIAWLHDIGRFQQWETYQTFLDSNSVDHARLGVQLLKENQKALLRAFQVDEKDEQLVLTAIAQHNKFQIEKGIQGITYTQCCIIRDADKLDIFRVDEQELEEILFLCDKKTLENDTISDAVFEDMMHNKSILTTKRKTHLDILMSHLALIYDLNYSYSLQIVKTENFIERILHKYEFTNQETIQQIACIKQQLLQYINIHSK